MSVINKFLLFAMIGHFVFSSTASMAYSRMGKATIQQGSDGQPCFGIENTIATRMGFPRLESITVYAQLNEQEIPIRVWSFMIEPGSSGLPFEPGQCITYGIMPNGMRNLVKPTPLKFGIAYTVSIGARISDTTDPTFAYQAEFCLIPDSPTPRVHQIRWDAKASKWQRDVCFAPKGIQAIGSAPGSSPKSSSKEGP